MCHYSGQKLCLICERSGSEHPSSRVFWCSSIKVVKSKQRWFFLKWTSCTSQFLWIKSSVWWSSPNSFCERKIKTLDQLPSLSLCWHECWSCLLSHIKRMFWVLSRSLPCSVQCDLLWTTYFEQICAMNTFFSINSKVIVILCHAS